MEEINETKSNIEILNECLKNKNEDKAAEYLLEIYKEAQHNFKKNLLIGGVLPEPSSYDLNKKIYIFEYFKKSCDIVINHLIDERTKEDFRNQVRTIVKAYEIIVHHNTSNEERCNTCDFLHYDKARQLQMICIFIEDQMRLASINKQEKIDKKGVYTGTESSVPLEVDGNQVYKLSAKDAIETNMEIADELIKFIFFINKKDMKKVIDTKEVDSCPYEVPSYEEIMHLTSHRVMVRKTWDLFKYRDWTLKVYEDSNGKYNSFEPEDYKDFKRESASIQRVEYDEYQKSMSAVSLWKIFNDRLERVLHKTSNIKLENVFDINLEDVKELMTFYKSIIISTMQFDFEFYGENLLTVEVVDGIEFKYIFETISYLYSMASVYSWKAYKEVDENNTSEYYKFAPIINVDKLISKLAQVLSIDERIARKCIDIFIFKPQCGKKQIGLDLFSQPLVYVSAEQVVFTPCFILQMNVKRIINKILGAINYNFSEKGYNMEDSVNNMLEKSEYLKVNKNRIKFEAYDGKDAEFDSISLFGDKLIVMEMKCRNTPYSSKEKNDKIIVINEAVEQVKRRVRVIQNDWDEIKKRSSIKLMENPPAEKDIIKVVCLNFFDFTGQVIDDVYVTDYSAITKYFTKPIIYANVIKNNIKEKIQVENIWGGPNPTVENLLKYLEMPSMLKGFYENISLIYKPIIRIQESDENILVMDYYLKEDPYIKYSKLALEDKKSNTNNKPYIRERKIGRNELCPCGSGKKYKKCCGASSN